jgi:hypothetical protein
MRERDTITIASGVFENLPKISTVDIQDTPLRDTSKAAFRRVTKVVGIPTTFGIDPTAEQGWENDIVRFPKR